MSYPQQPGNWSDPSWPQGQPQPYGDPSQPSGVPASPAAYPTSPTSGYPGYPPQTYPAQAYPAQAYPAAYPTYGYNAPQVGTPRVNGLAIASLICSIAGIVTCGVTSLVGAILGHVSRGQITQRQESGGGMALGGIITGWVVTALWAVIWALFIIGIIASEDASRTSGLSDFLTAFSRPAA